MSEYIKSIINTLQLRMKDYSEESDTYREMQNTIDMLNHALKLEQKLVRQY